MSDRVYKFVEPHFTGGDAVITITESKILKYMKSRFEKEPKFKKLTDFELLDYFLVNHWCIEVE
jgi:hypothetical protein